MGKKYQEREGRWGEKERNGRERDFYCITQGGREMNSVFPHLYHVFGK